MSSASKPGLVAMKQRHQNQASRICCALLALSTEDAPDVARWRAGFERELEQIALCKMLINAMESQPALEINPFVAALLHEWAEAHEVQELPHVVEFSRMLGEQQDAARENGYFDGELGHGRWWEELASASASALPQRLLDGNEATSLDQHRTDSPALPALASSSSLEKRKQNTGPDADVGSVGEHGDEASDHGETTRKRSKLDIMSIDEVAVPLIPPCANCMKHKLPCARGPDKVSSACTICHSRKTECSMQGTPMSTHSKRASAESDIYGRSQRGLGKSKKSEGGFVNDADKSRAKEFKIHAAEPHIQSPALSVGSSLQSKSTSSLSVSHPASTDDIARTTSAVESAVADIASLQSTVNNLKEENNQLREAVAQFTPAQGTLQNTVNEQKDQIRQLREAVHMMQRTLQDKINQPESKMRQMQDKLSQLDHTVEWLVCHWPRADHRQRTDGRDVKPIIGMPEERKRRIKGSSEEK
ncbi:hypothetical protein EVG20_g2414 [Dentipellis fragilis]|uniref:Zn(2)-C6 fungal-type domain-containing protein n=1 Tax=Dentipellis fragilis TaxID=205917 RepID=A0A4Y9Z9U2_9AGAM|nr:hypothetical protein EVG20_g2414 [Dentipellis fragilis]